MALSFLIVHDPGADIEPAKRAADAASAAVTFHIARDPETLMDGLDAAETTTR